MTSTGIVPQNMSRPGVPYATPAELEQKEAEASALAEEARQFNSPTLTPLLKQCLDSWARNRRYKETTGIDTEMLKNLRQINGDYEADILTDIRIEGGSEAFLLITAMKTRAATAWFLDVLSDEDEKAWSTRPSPIPDMPPEVMQQVIERAAMDIESYLQGEEGRTVTPQEVAAYAKQLKEDVEQEIRDEAKSRAILMERKVDDQLKEGKFSEAFLSYVENLVSLKSGFLKGPIQRKVPSMAYANKDGRTQAVVKDAIKSTYEAPSPFDMFPAPGATSCQQGDLWERVRFFPKALAAMRGIPGSSFSDAAIDLVLNRYGKTGFSVRTTADSDREEQEDKGADREAWGTIEGLEGWISVMGKTLIDDGMTHDDKGNRINPGRHYEINVILIDNYIIFNAFNPHPLGERPYSHSGWQKISGSFWYKGVPECIRDVQKLANCAVRALANNMGLASGPGIIYNDINRLPVGQDPTAISPLGVYQFINPGMSQLKPMETIDIESHAQELLMIIKEFSKMADEHSGIPSYEHGSGGGFKGGGRTLGGMEMLMTNAARSLKLALLRSDQRVLRPTVERQIVHNMLYDPDESIKGDLELFATGVLAKINKEAMTARRIEFLNATGNPTDILIMGVKKRARIQDEVAATLEMRVGEFSRSEKEYEELQQMFQEQQEQKAAAAVA